MKELRNKISQAELRERLLQDPRPRTTLSFYLYHPIAEVQQFRDELFRGFTELEVLGRIYVAHEGINAQLSVPTNKFASLRQYLYSHAFMDGMRLNVAVEEDGKSFWVLNVKVRPRIVADGIEDPTFSMEKRGEYLKAEEFNALTEDPHTIVVDMRNYYEYEVGHFENALEVSSDTFREQLPMAVELLKEHRDKNIVMYCTGGIRCEKASAYLKHHGFPSVYHLEGGIIEYTRQVREQGLTNKFRGKNFVFDNRLGEQITGEVISHCHQCEALCDTHRNCANDACHLLFLQCETCAAQMEGCCSKSCRQEKTSSAPDQTAQPPAAEFNNSRSRLRARFFDVRGRK